MIAVQTLWTQPYKKYHSEDVKKLFLLQALSSISISNFYETHLVTDSYGAKIVAEMGLPYHTVSTDLDEIDGFPESFWAYPKFLAYKKYIKAEYVFDVNGNEIGNDAFNIDIAVTKDKFPVFVTEKEGNKFYVIPVRGVGLWDAIWGYISINEELKVDGIVFDHKAETPGLGAEIREDFFTKRFVGESIFDANGSLQAVKVVKGYTGGDNKEDGEVDAISGATLTGNGVTNMLASGLKPYEKFLKSHKK